MDPTQVTTLWRLVGVDGKSQTGDQVTFAGLAPGRHRLLFFASRTFDAAVFCRHRWSTQTVRVPGMRALTNRTFDASGAEIGANARNELAQHLFGATASAAGELGAVDVWSVHVTGTLFDSVTSSDVVEKDFGAIDDAVLVLEYDVGD